MPDVVDEIAKLKKICEEGLQVSESNDLRSIMFFTRRAKKELEYIEYCVEDESFKDDLKKYTMWISKEGAGEKCYLLVVCVYSINWDIEVLSWCNADFDKKYPRGSSSFEKFREDFIPYREGA